MSDKAAVGNGGRKIYSHAPLLHLTANNVCFSSASRFMCVKVSDVSTDISISMLKIKRNHILRASRISRIYKNTNEKEVRCGR